MRLTKKFAFENRDETTSGQGILSSNSENLRTLLNGRSLKVTNDGDKTMLYRFISKFVDIGVGLT